MVKHNVGEEDDGKVQRLTRGSCEGIPVDERDHGPPAAPTAAHAGQHSTAAAGSSDRVVPHTAATCRTNTTTITSSNVVTRHLCLCYIVKCLPFKKRICFFPIFRLFLTAFFGGLNFTVVSHDLHHVTQAGA